MGEKGYTIPRELNVEYFFNSSLCAGISESDYKELQLNEVEFFPYELLFYMGKNGYKPWEHTEEAVPALFEYWKGLHAQLEELFRARKAKETAPLMRKGIACCFSSLFWINEMPVMLEGWEAEAASLPFANVNFSERMGFILQRPALYQSFKTLEQIMIELEKVFARSLIKKKRKK
ncbi:YpoC family protein [Bacillus sp. 1P06AnD]|uniref:YpoC family protein n=1 Tax=Bacillus sp. 1P06AnD TaxID=3132208 RepID=UPI00399EF026